MLKRYQIATIAVLLASTASAQEFYVGGTVSAGQANFADNYSNEFEGNTQTLSLLGGVRFPIGGAAGSGMFVGGEVEVSFAQGYEGLTYADLSDTQKTIQAEIHVGYQMNTVAVYGFYGIGSNPMTRGYAISESNLAIYGIGAELDISDSLALRAEFEMSSMTFDSCASYDANLSRFSIGCIVKF